MARLDWTEARDGWLRRLRAEGYYWAEIAAELGVTLDVARERGRQIGAPAPMTQTRSLAEDQRRPPLPPGHPRAWGLLNEGTVLSGTDWPGWD
jgi:hypothetical protein